MNASTERGSATVEFVGVGVLVAACALAVIQVGVVAHVSAILTDSAIAGAAYAALADSSLAAGIDRTRELAKSGIAADLVTDITARQSTISGRPIATITVRFRVPTVGPWLPIAESSVTGRAFLEIP